MYNLVNGVGMTAPPCAFDAFGGVFFTLRSPFAHPSLRSGDDARVPALSATKELALSATKELALSATKG